MNFSFVNASLLIGAFQAHVVIRALRPHIMIVFVLYTSDIDLAFAADNVMVFCGSVFEILLQE